MAKMEITPEMMNSIAKELDQKIEEWKTSVTSVYNLVAELTTEFEGTASERLKARMNEDQPKYNALGQLMTEYRNAIVKAAADYTAADDDAASVI
jgi:WXG100 family type VII secretion target